MFKSKKKKRLEEVMLFEDGFLSGISYALDILEQQKENYGEIANIDDLVDLVKKSL